MPEIECPHWCLGEVYEKQGYWSRTEDAYRKAVEVDPQDPKSRQKLAEWIANKPGGMSAGS